MHNIYCKSNRTILNKKKCIQESFNTYISHQLFDYKITFVNSQPENIDSKGDFVKTSLEYKNKPDSYLVLRIQLMSI